MRAFPRATAEKCDGAPLALRSKGMDHPLVARLLVLVIAITIGCAIDARAADPDTSFPHIRSTDARLRALIDDALATSATVRALAERITASDVVVFVACDNDPYVRGPGRLNFMSAAGGLRYVLGRVLPHRRDLAIAMLGREPQHAVQLAETPSIVDADSLAREYARMGYRRHSSQVGLAFDTEAAVDTGERVHEEVRLALRDGS